MLQDADYTVTAELIAGGFHSVLSVPLIHDGAPIGAISVGRPEAGSFPAEQITLLKTFADQAVIAIENVRLFDEVEARTRELSDSLQQQTATADVLKVISRSAFDLQKVLDTLTESACKLCDAEGSNIWRPDGDVTQGCGNVRAVPDTQGGAQAGCHQARKRYLRRSRFA